jgi:uncharacterized OsmC-like protein
MRTDLSVRAVHRDNMRVDVPIRGQVLSMDYPVQQGGLATPLEVLLASLAACAANTLHFVIAKKAGTRIDSLEVEARAERSAEHPTVLTAIELLYRLRGDSLDLDVLNTAVRTAEDRLCPVLAMLRPGTHIRSAWRIDPPVMPAPMPAISSRSSISRA